MFIDGVTQVGTCSAEEYLFHFHETHESGKFYYLRLAVPILAKDESESHMTSYLTYRTHVDISKGMFRNLVMQDGIGCEVAMVGHQRDKWVVCNNENFNEKMIEFLQMFKEDGLYKKIPEIKELMNQYPEAKI